MVFLIFSFDGSGKNAETAVHDDEHEAKQSDKNITNVVKLHLLCGGNLLQNGAQYGKSTQTNVTAAFYYPGVGVYGGKLQKLVNMAFAPENADVASILKKAKTDFINHLPEDISKLAVLITGYSRGAALGRRFATIIHRHINNENSSGRKTPDKPFIFLNVWDTVASIGLPDVSTENRPKFEVVFEEGNTLSSSVCQANHMVSLDEKRRSFQPTLMNYDPTRVLEIWFAGAHGDIGGGYLKDGLSDICLDHSLWWLQTMTTHHSLPSIDFTFPSEAALDEACEQHVRAHINRDDLVINANPLGVNHQQVRPRVIAMATLYDRICCVINNDKMDDSLPPLIHHSVPIRIYRDPNYNPISLARMQIEHRVWSASQVVSDLFKGIQAHQEHDDFQWKTIEPGQSVDVLVEADRKFNFSGIRVNAGEVWSVSVADDQTWHDADIRCDANGWDRSDITKGWKEIAIAATEGAKRVPEAKWFSLCGAIGTDESSYMAIGKCKEIRVTQSGELTLFANDLNFMYHNNWGGIEVKVTRLS